MACFFNNLRISLSAAFLFGRVDPLRHAGISLWIRNGAPAANRACLPTISSCERALAIR